LLASSEHNLQTSCVTSKNKFEKLVHLVGSIIRIYHDALSSECQTRPRYVTSNSTTLCNVSVFWYVTGVLR